MPLHVGEVTDAKIVNSRLESKSNAVNAVADFSAQENSKHQDAYLASLANKTNERG